MKARHAGLGWLGRLALPLMMTGLIGITVFPARAVENETRRWSLELFDGFAGLGLGDFNLLAESDQGLREFLYDDFLEDLAARGEILSWEARADQDFPRLRWSLPFGARLRFQVRDGLSLSLGYRRLARENSSDPSFSYTRNSGRDFSQTEEIVYQEYALSVAGSIPQIGIHVRLVRWGDFGIEIYTVGGPLYAECRFVRDRIYNWSETWQGSTYTVFESRDRLEEEGDGVGVALEAGLRLNLVLSGRLSGFMESGWASQVVGSISGPGRETILGDTASWEGEWEIRREVVTTTWGEYEYLYPSNLQPRPSTTMSQSDFRLDLSGFQLRLGLAFRF